jgi:hypothetical protein
MIEVLTILTSKSPLLKVDVDAEQSSRVGRQPWQPSMQLWKAEMASQCRLLELKVLLIYFAIRFA